MSRKRTQRTQREKLKESIFLTKMGWWQSCDYVLFYVFFAFSVAELFFRLNRDKTA